MAHYKGAMYQRDVMEELSRQADVEFYGPGFEDFDSNLDIEKVVTLKGGHFDWLIIGHAWLSDRGKEDVDPIPDFRLEKAPVPKAVILNKEYVNLKKKLEWIKQKGFDQAFTHHHHYVKYSVYTGVPFEFWPFGFDHRRFGETANVKKNIHFAFSGILQNHNHRNAQSDLRLRIMKRLFISGFDIPLFKRRRYRNYSLFWNPIPRKRMHQRLAVLLGRYRYLPTEKYVEILARSQIILNTLSPAGLVSPRFCESMASRSLVLCEDQKNFSRIFPKDCFVTFKSDLSDFEEKLFFYMDNERKRLPITERAYSLVMKEHTLACRVKRMLCVLENGAR